MARYRNARGQFISKAAHQRSIAAKRAWKVRREKAKARSRAAKKGWKTRRKKKHIVVPPKPPKAPEREYIATIKYKSTRPGHGGRVQASIFAREGTSKAELQESLDQALRGGTSKYPVRAIEWLTRSRNRRT